MNWNALEWDRAAEELTWERVSPHDIADLQTDLTPVYSYFSACVILGSTCT